MSDQKISCEGCGSKWTVIGVGNHVLARLDECPLCSAKSMPFSNHFLILHPKTQKQRPK